MVMAVMIMRQISVSVWSVIPVLIVKQRFVPVMDDWTVKANVSAHQDIPEQTHCPLINFPRLLHSDESALIQLFPELIYQLSQTHFCVIVSIYPCPPHATVSQFVPVYLDVQIHLP